MPRNYFLHNVTPLRAKTFAGAAHLLRTYIIPDTQEREPQQRSGRSLGVAPLTRDSPLYIAPIPGVNEFIQAVTYTPNYYGEPLQSR